MPRFARSLTRCRPTALLLVASFACSLGVNAASANSPLPTPDLDVQHAAAAALGVNMSPNGWILYTRPQSAALGLTKAVTVTTRGKRQVDGSCDISMSLPTATEVNSYSEQIGLNPKTCEAKFITGQISAKAIATLNAPKADLLGAIGDGVGASPNLGSVTGVATTKYKTAYTLSRWIDPVAVVITSQAADLSWPLYGARGSLKSASPIYKFKYDGWSVSGPHSSKVTALSAHKGWTFGSKAHFVNTDFAAIVYALLGLSGWLACGAHLTSRADFYHNVRVTGYRNGARGQGWTNRVSGACSNLVHVQAWGQHGWR